MSPSFPTVLSLAALALSGCAQHGAPSAPKSGLQAAATLMTPDGKPAGRATFTEAADGVHITLDATGLTPGQHGVHLHANGACVPGPDPATGNIVPFGAAGGHFDPQGAGHHGHPDAPVGSAHAGELPNATADANGNASLHRLNRQVTLSPGKTSIIGRSIVVHANPDDYTTNPAGNSGPRVLCGVIAATPT